VQLSDKIPLDYDSLRAAYVNLLKEVERLRKKLEQLQTGSNRTQVAEANEVYPRPAKATVAQPAEANSRLTLFRSLFGGREDVYAQRWEKADGSSNYSPAKHHDWDSHTKSDKGKMICGAACQLLALTDRVLDEHLKGQRTIGIYPLLKDETCRLLAADFDEANWQDDVLAFLDTCDRLGVPGYLERSRSGNGAHVWIFFDKPVRAYQARSLGSFQSAKIGCANGASFICSVSLTDFVSDFLSGLKHCC
jgi:hypothetical protein